MNEVDLAQVGLRRVSGHPGAVLHGDPSVGVTDDAQPCDQGDLLGDSRAEAVLGIAADGHDRRLLGLTSTFCNDYRLPDHPVQDTGARDAETPSRRRGGFGYPDG